MLGALGHGRMDCDIIGQTKGRNGVRVQDVM